jgi:L-rhamnose-H+ transport protein
LIENWTTGLTLILMAGILQGSFALPMKYTSKWNWENTWLSYSLMAYLIFPWLVAVLAVPELKEILQQTSTATFLRTILFGFGWGLGCLTFGLGIDYLGLSLGFAVILGLTAAVGTLIPLLVLSPEKLMSAQGALLMTGVVTMLVGISLCSWAGKLKENALKAGFEGPNQAPRKSYALGLLFCILSGVLSACANLGFAFGTEVTSLATKWGTRQQYASIPLWAVMMLPLFLCNGPFCLYLLVRKQSLAKFLLPQTGRYFFLAGSMALMWLVGMLFYGFGANKLGKTGSSIGWAILMSSVVIVANLWGLTTREWRGTGLGPKRTMRVGLLILVVAIFIIGGAK